MKGKELLDGNLQEYENKRVGDFGDANVGRDVLFDFTRHGSTEATILKVKYIERGEFAVNGEKSGLSGE